MKSGFSTRFGKFNVLIFVVFVAVVTIVLAVMLSGLIRESSSTYARFYSVETVDKLSTYLNREIALVSQVARSSAVIEWFADETNAEKRLDAYEEMTDYTEMFDRAVLYFGINASLNEFSITSGASLDDFRPFDQLSPDAPYDDWYFECINSIQPYKLNLDVDKVTRVQRVWINHKVMDGGKPVGVFCTSLMFDEVYNKLFANYDASNMMGLVMDSSGYVQINSADKEVGMVYADYADFDDSNLPLITDFNNEEDFASAIVKRLAAAHYRLADEPVVLRLYSPPFDYVSIAGIENTDWTAVTFFNSGSLYGFNRFYPLIIVLGVLLAVYLVASNILIKRFNKHNEQLILSRDEKNALAERNQMLNTVAKTLLSASEGMDFEASLVKGMTLIGVGMGTDRIFVWQNERRNGKRYYRSQYRWLSGNGRRGKTVSPNDLFPYGEASTPEWAEKLSRGESVNGPVSSFSPYEQEIFKKHGIVSVLIIPIRMKNEFWGFISFDDCVHERYFTGEEVDLLRSGALMLANAVNRNAQDLAVQDALAAALAASKAKGNFLSNMSHEIRTPLNAIIGMTAIGKSTEDPERKSYAFEKIDGASNHLLGVINDILDMSKIEAGKFGLSLVPFNFKALLKRVMGVIHFRVEEKKQIFTFHADKRIPEVLLGDDQRLAQVIANLISNAVKFTPEGKRIRLDAVLTDAGEGIYNVRISVRDEGIGISQEQQKRLFKSFEQAENDTTRKYGGTGLGLAISKHIVEQMGGKLHLKSEQGQGSEFYFTIPFRLGAEQAAVKDAAFVDGGDINFEGRWLLLAEDIDINREIVTAMLEPTLIEIDYAENGVEAVKKVSEAAHRYDLIFMDVQMPEMDGFEATRRIRALDVPGAADVPIIAMTANVFREDVEKCVAAGMNGHVGKPLGFDAVMGTLREWLKGCCDG